jgi:hypothetical protein
LASPPPRSHVGGTSARACRINELCGGNFRAAQFIVGALPRVLELPEDDVRRAIHATEDELDARERARIEEQEERRYREKFKPHAIWITEHDRPTSIVMAAFYGIPRLLKFNLDLDRGEETFVSQVIAAMPATIPFFGTATGFTINYNPNRAVQYESGAVVPCRDQSRGSSQLNHNPVRSAPGRCV